MVIMSDEAELSQGNSPNIKVTTPAELKPHSISESPLELGDTPNKKRHVIKAKHIKTANLDVRIKNSPLSKSIGLIDRFSKRNQSKTKKKYSAHNEANEQALSDKIAEESSDKELKRNSIDARESAPPEKEDVSPKKIPKENTTQSNGSSKPNSPVPGKKSAKDKKSLKKTTKAKEPTKRNAKIEVKSHVLTDFYPVRRSSRKSKSLLEKEQDDFVIEAIRSNCEDGLAVVKFEDKGRGVVAKRAFKKGHFIVEYAGDLIDWNEAKQRETEYAMDASVGCYMYYFIFDDINYCVDATVESGRLGRLLNHSRKNPNCKAKLVRMPDPEGKGTLPHLIIVAKRDINAGDELMYDYGDRDKDTLQSHPWLKST